MANVWAQVRPAHHIGDDDSDDDSDDCTNDDNDDDNDHGDNSAVLSQQLITGW